MSEPPTDPSVVDLSHWNPEPDWDQLVLGGVVGVILKATEGTGYIDPTYADRRESAMSAGLAVASYHYLKHGNVDLQMQHYLDTVIPVPGERMILDHEDRAVTLDDLKAAVTVLQAQPLDLQVTVYSGHTIKDQLGNGHDALLATTSLWIAQYTSAASPGWPKGTWPAWTLWQYTDKAQVPSISQPVDGNRFNGSTENLLRWLNPAATPAPAPLPEPWPEPLPAPVPVTTPAVYISMPPGVDVDIFVNGVQVA